MKQIHSPASVRVLYIFSMASGLWRKYNLNEYTTVPWVVFIVNSLVSSLSVALADTISEAVSDTVSAARFFVFAAIVASVQFFLLAFLCICFKWGGGSLASPDATIEGDTVGQRAFFFVFGTNRPVVDQFL